MTVDASLTADSDRVWVSWYVRSHIVYRDLRDRVAYCCPHRNLLVLIRIVHTWSRKNNRCLITLPLNVLSSPPVHEKHRRRCDTPWACMLALCSHSMCSLWLYSNRALSGGQEIGSSEPQQWYLHTCALLLEHPWQKRKPPITSANLLFLLWCFIYDVLQQIWYVKYGVLSNMRLMVVCW